MVRTYLQPLVDALWAGEATDASDVISVVSTCDHLLYSLDAAERSSTRWLVCPPLSSSCVCAQVRGAVNLLKYMRCTHACMCGGCLLRCNAVCLFAPNRCSRDAGQFSHCIQHGGVRSRNVC